MSRTVRRKQGYGWCYGMRHVSESLEEWYWNTETGWSDWIHHDPRSKEGKKRIALFHSDAQSWTAKYGPSWWRRQYYQRPYRRNAETEIKKYFKDTEYEVIIPDRPKLGYWD